MSTNGYPPTPAVQPGDLYDALLEEDVRPRPKYWLHALLLLLTLLTTTVVGAGLAQSFARNQPFSYGFDGYIHMWRDPAYLLAGLPFSVTLLAILLTHEMGHYLAARYYHVEVTLPFFLPAPTLIGTFGAFIRIRSAILSKRVLFDIGIAGPLAGFAMLIGPLAAGLSLSKVIPGHFGADELVFGTPLIFRLFELVLFPGISPEQIYLHPVARAAWVGVLATALNLLPIGQLDGGHILYAFLGERTRLLSRVFVGVLVLMGFFFAWSWFFWAAFLFFTLRHPAIVDPSPLGKTRTWLGFVALLILVLSFTPAPLRIAGT